MQYWMRRRIHLNPDVNSEERMSYQKYFPHRFTATTFFPFTLDAKSFAVVSLNSIGSSNFESIKVRIELYRFNINNSLVLEDLFKDRPCTFDLSDLGHRLARLIYDCLDYVF